MSDYFLLLEYVWTLGLLLSQITLYGYMELKWNSGWVISVLIALILLYQRGTFIPTFISICGVLSSLNNSPKLSSVFFLILEGIYFFGASKNLTNDEDVIRFKPYEKEIRQYLLTKDSSLLHKVDDLLIKYEGREDELMRKLKSKYEITSHTAPSKKPAKSAEIVEPIVPIPPPVPTTKWGPFDTALSTPSHSTNKSAPSTHAKTPTNFSSASSASASSHSQQPSTFTTPSTKPTSFSFFSSQPISTNKQSTPEPRKSGQYGVLEILDDDDDDDDHDEDDEDDEDEDDEDVDEVITIPSRTIQQKTSTQYFSQQQPQPHHQQQQHGSDSLFHAQTNEVDEAKRRARESMQARANQRFHHN